MRNILFIFFQYFFPSASHCSNWGLAKFYWRSTDLHYCPPSAWWMFFTMVMKWRCLVVFHPAASLEPHRPLIWHLRRKHPGPARWDFPNLDGWGFLGNPTHGWQHNTRERCLIWCLLCSKRGLSTSWVVQDRSHQPYLWFVAGLSQSEVLRKCVAQCIVGVEILDIES